MKNLLGKFVHTAFLIVTLNCSGNSENFSVSGTVQSVDYDEMEISISHDSIPGLMPPMTMPFRVRDLFEIKKLQIGDSVHFSLVWDEFSPFAKDFKIVGKGKVVVPDDFFSDEFSEKMIGEIIDDVSLLNLDSIVVKLSDSDGRFRFISYMFSRCPMPNMCPALIIKNQALAQAFPEVDFILISFDYKNDIPSLLQMEYANILKEINNLTILSSTGYIEDVYKLIRQSGGDFWGVENNKIGHKMSSILLSPTRELLSIWRGEDWTVQQINNSFKLIKNL